MISESNKSYFNTTFRATITAEQLLKDYSELKQWKFVAKKYNVSHAYIIRMRKILGIFEKTITSGKQYSGLNSAIGRRNGCKRMDNRGYIRIGRYHPTNTHGFEEYEHRLIMEKVLGRNLTAGEIIHHIDGNKSNNNIENLWLCNHSLHRLAEESTEIIVQELYKKGIVGFNKSTGIYFFK